MLHNFLNIYSIYDGVVFDTVEVTFNLEKPFYLIECTCFDIINNVIKFAMDNHLTNASYN